MPDLCATTDGGTVCIPLDLTVLEDAGRVAAEDIPGAAADARRRTTVPLVRTRVARGAVPEAWPRAQRIAAELVKGQERVPCQLLLHEGEGLDAAGSVDLILIGEEVYTAVTGRAAPA